MPSIYPYPSSLYRHRPTVPTACSCHPPPPPRATHTTTTPVLVRLTNCGSGAFRASEAGRLGSCLGLGDTRSSIMALVSTQLVMLRLGLRLWLTLGDIHSRESR